MAATAGRVSGILHLWVVKEGAVDGPALSWSCPEKPAAGQGCVANGTGSSPWLSEPELSLADGSGAKPVMCRCTTEEKEEWIR